MILIGDEIFTKVGGFVLGNVRHLGHRRARHLHVDGGLRASRTRSLLGLLVALLDLIPVIGSTIGGAIVTLVALTVSLPVAIATLGLLRRLPAGRGLPGGAPDHGQDGAGTRGVSVVAVLIGGALMGIVGALVAIPAAAALRLFLQEVVFHRLDDS